MKFNCEIVLDLAGRYFDGTASAETVRAVREHLGDCPDCNRFYRHFSLLRKQRSAAKHSDEDLASNNFAALADKLRMRKLFMRLAIVIYAGILAAAFTVLWIIGRKNNAQRRTMSLFDLFK